MAEKLLNTREVSKYLDIPEEEIRKLVERGELPAYRLGGSILRFRKDQIEEIKQKGLPRISALEKEAASAPQSSFFERIKDFIYFNDFYVISVVIVVILVVIIFYY